MLGSFQDANPLATVADFTAGGGSAAVDWGDGSAAEILTAANFALVGTPNGVTFVINANHTYLDEGTYSYTILVTDDGGSTTLIGGSAIIADAALTPGLTPLLTGNTGVPGPPVIVGSFTDGNIAASTADFTGIVDWGDGSPNSAATFQRTIPGFFNVFGAHTYAKPGTYTVTTKVFDVGGSTTTLTASYSITDLPVTGATNSFTAVEGQSTGLFPLATFEDPNTLATLSDVKATLAIGGWGDGTPTTAGVQLVIQQIGVDPTNGEPVFDVLGSHTYADATPPHLPDPLSVIITTLGGQVTTLTSPPGGGVTVLDAKLGGTAGNEIAGIEGNSTGTVLLGSFVDANQGATIADFTVAPGSTVVNWGDGSSPQTLTAANFTMLGTPNGVTFAISAAHTYAEEGTYAYTVTVTDTDGAVTIVNGSAVIADAPLTAGASVIRGGSTGISLGDVFVGSFTDANPGATIERFHGRHRLG